MFAGLIVLAWLYFVVDATHRKYIGFIERDGNLVVITKDGVEMPRRKKPKVHVTYTKTHGGDESGSTWSRN